MSCTMSGARPIDGSSSVSSRGSAISARPIAASAARRRRSGPPATRRRSASLGKKRVDALEIAPRSRARDFAGADARRRSDSPRPSAARTRGGPPAPAPGRGAPDRRASRSSSRAPSKVARSAVAPGRARPAADWRRRCSVVVLPAPLAPSSATISPRRTSRSTRVSATIAPL